MNDKLYLGCPVQHARQFIAGKWQIGILWNLKNESPGFNSLKAKLPGISDKIFMQELEFFLDKKMIRKDTIEFSPYKAKYALTSYGLSLMPVITAIVEWGYANLQDERITKDMASTPSPVIDDIEKSLSEKNQEINS